MEALCISGGLLVFALGVLFAGTWHMLTRPVIRLVEIIEQAGKLQVKQVGKDFSTSSSYYPPEIRVSEIDVVFIRLAVKNKPIISWLREAEDVRALVKCVGRTSGRVVSPYFARPGNSPAPDDNHSTDDAQRISIPAGETRFFNLAIKFPDGSRFGFSPKSYQHYSKSPIWSVSGDNDTRFYDFKEPTLDLSNEPFDAVITVTHKGVLKPLTLMYVFGEDNER